MDQANFWQAWGALEPALLNQQQGDNPRSFQARFPGSVTSLSDSLIPSPLSHAGFASPPSQSPSDSLILSPTNYAGFSSFVTPLSQSLSDGLIAGFSSFVTPLSQSPSNSLILSLASYADFASLPPGQSPSDSLISSFASLPSSQTSGASLIPSLANYAGFLSFVTSPIASLPDANLTSSLANYADFSSFVTLPNTSLPDASLIPNYAGFSLSRPEETASTWLPLCAAYGLNHTEEVPARSRVSSSACIEYHLPNKPSLLQPQSDILKDVNSNFQIHQLCIRCWKLKQKVFLFS
jgi:hypothetical protein